MKTWRTARSIVALNANRATNSSTCSSS